MSIPRIDPNPPITPPDWWDDSEDFEEED